MNIKHVNNYQPFQADINRHRNLLIIGEGATTYKVGEIAYYDSTEIVEKLYGISKLSEAFTTAKRIGVPNIFVVNTRRKTDYIEVLDVIKHYDFTYIAPIGINFSEEFINPIEERLMTYAELYLNTLGDYSRSTIIMTESHASLYEDIDHFLNDMRNKIYKFKNISQRSLRNGRNLCLVANNLEDYDYANIVLASMLCVSEYSTYPEYKVGKAVFDIDDLDIENLDLAYFRNNSLISTSIENLKNFRIENDPAKIVLIDAVIKFIERELDFTEYKGKQFNDYLKYKLYQQLGEFLRNNVGYAIRNYSINSIDFVATAPGTGSIINDFTILPINSTEQFNIVLEV